MSPEEEREREREIMPFIVATYVPDLMTVNIDSVTFMRQYTFQFDYINVPQSISTCTNINCTDRTHLSEIDSFMETIMDDITVAADQTIPKTKPKPKNKKELVGWKDYVEPYQDAAKFWFSIWTSAGRPINTVLHSIMKKTRNQFHYQIRKCKRVENFIKNKKLVENCLEGEILKVDSSLVASNCEE